LKRFLIALHFVSFVRNDDIFKSDFPVVLELEFAGNLKGVFIKNMDTSS
jgi:hypothetical protein